MTPSANAIQLTALPTVDAAGLAAILHCSVDTVVSNAHRAPGRLPPQLKTGGRRLLWLLSDVMAWLEAHRAGPAPAPAARRGHGGAATPVAALPRRRGRPTKAEQLARRAGGVR
jgi:hypothetical protein